MRERKMHVLVMSSSIFGRFLSPASLSCVTISALGVSTLSYAWWMFTNKEYQYSNIFEFLFKRTVKKRYKAGGLDEVRLAEALVRSKPVLCPGAERLRDSMTHLWDVVISENERDHAPELYSRVACSNRLAVVR